MVKTHLFVITIRSRIVRKIALANRGREYLSKYLTLCCNIWVLTKSMSQTVLTRSYGWWINTMQYIFMILLLVTIILSPLPSKKGCYSNVFSKRFLQHHSVEIENQFCNHNIFHVTNYKLQLNEFFAFTFSVTVEVHSKLNRGHFYCVLIKIDA